MIFVVIAEGRNRRTFMLGPRWKYAAMRTFGVLDLACAAFLLWIGIALTVAGPTQWRDPLGWVGMVGGVVALWAGLVSVHAGVVVNRTHLISGQSLLLRRRVTRDAVLAVDIRQRNFGRAPRSVPVAALRDGSELSLMPLATLLTRGDRGQRLAAQHTLVAELRRALGVSGSDLHDSDIRWPSAASR